MGSVDMGPTCICLILRNSQNSRAPVPSLDCLQGNAQDKFGRAPSTNLVLKYLSSKFDGDALKHTLLMTCLFQHHHSLPVRVLSAKQTRGQLTWQGAENSVFIYGCWAQAAIWNCILKWIIEIEVIT